MSEDNCAVKIAVRERPEENLKKGSSVIQYEQNNILIVDERNNHCFTFDHALGPDVPQQQIFDDLIKPLVIKVKKGFNCTALAYGQTGTGKSYTMGLNSNAFEGDQVGVIPRCLREILNFNAADDSIEQSTVHFDIFASFIEIYNEKAYDLLAENSFEPIMAKGYKYTGGIRTPLNTIQECYSILAQGNKNRHVRPTKMNKQSSRSHAIFTLHVRSKQDECLTSACLNLVDLAGSEGVRRTGAEGKEKFEGVNINQGLLCMGKVLQAMATGKKIPYRDSVLSFVLQESLNSNSYLTLLACISPRREDLSETLSTLRFAKSAKQLKHTPQVNNILAETKRKQYNKTPYKLSSTRVQSTTPMLQKRPYSSMATSTLIKNNTFSCTPSKIKKIDLNKLNRTEMGMTPKEKQKVNTGIVRPFLPPPQCAAAPPAFAFKGRESLLDGTIDSRASLMSLNISTSTTVDAAAVPTSINNVNGTISFSPIVRKCIAEMDNRILQLIETVRNKSNYCHQTIENTPYQPWPTENQSIPNSMREELKSIMQEAIMSKGVSQKDSTSPTNQNAKCQLFATSSPVFKVPYDPIDPNLKCIRKTNHSILDMSIENENAANISNSETFCAEQTIVKKPLRRSCRLSVVKSVASFAADQTTVNKSLRRSRRISESVMDKSLLPPDGDQAVIDGTLRRSRRISGPSSPTNAIASTSPSLHLSSILNTSSLLSPTRRRSKRKSMKQLLDERRRNIRLSAHLEEPEPKTETVVLNERKEPARRIRRTNTIDTLNNSVIAGYFDNGTASSTISSTNRKSSLVKHRAAVLKLLNTGSMRELQLLPQIGQKTAYLLMTQRTLKGRFKNLTEVEKLPIWRGNAWERFALANILQ